MVRQVEELWSLMAVTLWIQLHTAHIWRPESKDRHVAWTVSVTTTTVIFETMLVSPITCLESNPKSFISPILKASGHGLVCCSHDRRSVSKTAMTWWRIPHDLHSNDFQLGLSPDVVHHNHYYRHYWNNIFRPWCHMPERSPVGCKPENFP